MLPYIPYIAHHLHHFFPSSCFLSFRVSCLAVLIRLRFAYQCLFLHLLFVSLFLFPQLFSNHCFFPPSPSFTSLLAAFLPFSLVSPLPPHNIIGRGEVAVWRPSLPQETQRGTQLSPYRTPPPVFTSIMTGRGSLFLTLRFHTKMKRTRGRGTD